MRPVQKINRFDWVFSRAFFFLPTILYAREGVHVWVPFPRTHEKNDFLSFRFDDDRVVCLNSLRWFAIDCVLKTSYR